MGGHRENGPTSASRSGGRGGEGREGRERGWEGMGGEGRGREERGGEGRERVGRERRGGERRGGKRREESVWKRMEGRIGEGGRKSRGLDKFRFTGKMEREVEMEK